MVLGVLLNMMFLRTICMQTFLLAEFELLLLLQFNRAIKIIGLLNSIEKLQNDINNIVEKSLSWNLKLNQAKSVTMQFW